MDCLCLVRLSFVLTWWPHSSQVYLIPSCIDCSCVVRWSFRVAWYLHWLHWYFLSLCTDCSCLYRLAFCVKCELHWLHWNVLPMCTDWWCVVRLDLSVNCELTGLRRDYWCVMMHHERSLLITLNTSTFLCHLEVQKKCMVVDKPIIIITLHSVELNWVESWRIIQSTNCSKAQNVTIKNCTKY